MNCYTYNFNCVLFSFCNTLWHPIPYISFFEFDSMLYALINLFYRYSVWLRKNDVFTLHGLCDGFQSCTRETPDGVLIPAVFNVSQWMKDNIHPIKNHSKPHSFRIKRDPRTGKAKLSYRVWNSSKVRIPLL